MEIFFSNQLEILYENLKSFLFSKKCDHPFIKRMIIVPSEAIKSWLMLEMAKDKDLNIAFGVEIVHLDQAVDKLVTKRKTPSFLELSLLIQTEIKKMIDEKKGFDESFELLFRYLKISSNKVFSLKSERRLIDLSEKLTHLFLQYGIYGEEMIERWKLENPNDFQIYLFKKIFFEKDWPILFKELKDSLSTPKLNLRDLLQIHLFSISFLSKAHFQFFKKLSETNFVNYYFLSPCQLFWSDLQSEKEHYFYKKKLDRFMNEGQRLLLDEFLRNQNPLLANFGKIGREMAKLIEESDFKTYEGYKISKKIQHLDQYLDFDFEDLLASDEELTLLKAIQSDLTLLRNPILQDRLDFKASDESIQLHIATSLKREIEIAYDQLVQILDRDSSINPQDVIVMAPDIMKYEPFVKAVFDSDESCLPFQMMDLELPSKNLWVQEFLKILSLPKKRFSMQALIDLFSGIHFQEAQNLCFEDLEKIRKWLSNSDLKWGFDEEDRNHTLINDHCEDLMAENQSKGTLKHSLERLTSSLFLQPFSEAEYDTLFDILPLEGLQTSDAELLGRLNHLIYSLKDDLAEFYDRSNKNLSEWASLLENICKKYLGIDESLDSLSDEEYFLLNLFDEIRKASHKFPKENFSFSTIETLLDHGFHKSKIDVGSSHMNAIKFCSMLPMRAIPAKVIYLLGMNEGVFPRIEIKNSLDLRKNSETDYAPSKTDFDRYLFLESILSARDYFLMSAVSESNVEELSFKTSIVVDELLEYIESGYLIDGQSFKKQNVKIHPSLSFDKRYFEPTSTLKTFSERAYQLALSHYGLEKKETHHFIKSFENEAFKENEETISELTIDLKELLSFSKNPLKSYFNHKLGVYLKTEDDLFRSDEDFILSHLDASIIKKSILKTGTEKTLSYFDKQGKIPVGLFRDLAVQKIHSDGLEIDSYLSKYQISLDSLFKIDFYDGVDEPFKDDLGNWHLPPIEYQRENAQKIKFIGSIENISSKGVLVEGQANKEDSVKFWPLYLIFLMLVKQYPIAEPNLIFLKDGKLKSSWFDDPKDYFERYINHYLCSIDQASLIQPSWVNDFINEDQDLIESKVMKSLNNDFKTNYNQYLKWIHVDDKIPLMKEGITKWKEEVKLVYGEMFQEWFSR